MNYQGYKMIKIGSLKINYIAIIQYIFLYLFLICHDATIYRENTILFRIVIICISIAAILLMKRISFIWLCYIIGTIIYISFRGGTMSVLNLIEHILIVYVTINIDKENFCERFVKICMVFIIISLPFYILGVLKPNILLSIFKNETSVGWAYNGNPYYMRGRFFYTVRKMELYRNNSIFTEPGVYQIILNSVLFILLFMRDSLKRLSNRTIVFFIIIVSVTILTTTSTTGYLGMALIYIFYIMNLKSIHQLNKKDESIKISRKILMTVALVIFFLGINYFIMKDDSIINVFLIGKIAEMTSSGTSGHARTSMMNICWNFAKNYFFGVGEETVALAIKTLDNGANGAILIHSFASFGLIPTCLIVGFYYLKLFKKFVPIGMTLLIIGLYLNTALAQSRLLYPALIMLPIIYYDYLKKGQKRNV